MIDIGLEGKMLFAACGAGAAGVSLGSLWLAALAVVVTVALSWLHGVACVSHRGDQVVSGIINIIAAGMTAVLGIAWFRAGRADAARVRRRAHAGLMPQAARAVRGVPLVGPSSATACWAQRHGLHHAGPGGAGRGGCCTARASACACAPWAGTRTWWTPPACRWPAYAALTLNGVLCGLAGAYLVLAQNANFIAQHDGGRLHGAGRDDLRQVAAGGRVLGLPAVRFSGRGGHPAAGRAALPGVGEVPVQLIQALPYLPTVILLAGFINTWVAPAALGRPYVRDRG